MLAEHHGAHITESDQSVSVSNLSADSTLRIILECSRLSWSCIAFDDAQTPTNPSDINQDFEPFRVTIQKPTDNNEIFYILTAVGFRDWLDRGHQATCWQIARLTKPLVTQGRLYSCWEGPSTFTASPTTKSPWSLVKESGAARIVPRDIRHWLLIDDTQPDFSDPLQVFWSAKAVDALALSLANEIDPVTLSLIFKGPPKLLLEKRETTSTEIQRFGEESFATLQIAAHWVYEDSRQAEIKHSLLATEIARSGRDGSSCIEYLKANLTTALESAKIAYQMSLSELTKDTLKSLGDLRKAITEETAKATDATRQTVTAVSGALAVSIGLVAARLSTNIDPWLIAVVMLVITGYIGMIIYSGWGFIRLQRQLRKEWQPKLYRFLPEDEYKKMVTDPAEEAEQVFKYSAIAGFVAVSVISLGISVFSFVSQPLAKAPDANHSQEISIKNKNTVS